MFASLMQPEGSSRSQEASVQRASPLTSPTSHMKCVIQLTLLFAGEKQDGSLASLLMFSPTPEGDGEEEGKDKKKKKKE